KFNVETESSALPQAVYENDGDLLLTAEAKLVEIVNPLSTEDDYILAEEFLNLMLLDSIRTNVNDAYDPLSDCETDICENIATNNVGYVGYAFVTLNEENQIVLTVSFGRNQYPDIESSLYLTFNLEIDLNEMEMILTLDTMYLHQTEITKDRLDQIFNYLDKDNIESMITKGTLNLDDYTYTVSLVSE
ncbi:MAG: hypothetical protein K9L26_02080, partial [Candidatus Izimaplasma sp.]|nr:hypothetical protein [Candidatus Izimaplasma bacterium]